MQKLLPVDDTAALGHQLNRGHGHDRIRVAEHGQAQAIEAALTSEGGGCLRQDSLRDSPQGVEESAQS